jgi:hypothetical protein
MRFTKPRLAYQPPRTPEDWAARDLASSTFQALRNRFYIDKWKYRRWANACGRWTPLDPLPTASRDWYTYRLRQQRVEALAWMLKNLRTFLFDKQPDSVRHDMWQQFFKRGRD